MKQFIRNPDSKVPSWLECPKCKAKLCMDQGELLNDAHDIGVTPGVMIPCLKCMTFLELEEDYTLAPTKLKDVAMLLMDGQVRDLIRQVVYRPDLTSSDIGYYQKIAMMVVQFNAWRCENPNSELQIAYNFPGEVSVVGTLADSITSKMVTVNTEALRSFTELGWLVQRPGMPTVLMTRAATELSFGSKNESP